MINNPPDATYYAAAPRSGVGRASFTADSGLSDEDRNVVEVEAEMEFNGEYGLGDISILIDGIAMTTARIQTEFPSGPEIIETAIELCSEDI